MNSTAASSIRPPRIVITLADVTRATDPILTDHKNKLYIAAIRRAGGDPPALNKPSTDDQRRQAFAAMDGLLLSGGADIDPARYRASRCLGARDIPARARPARGRSPCRGRRGRPPGPGHLPRIQALNAFRGGTLIQHVDGHETPDPLLTGLARHDLDIRLGTRLAAILLGRETDAGTARGGSEVDGSAAEPAPRLLVNTYHHQGVPPEGLAPGLVSAGTAEHAGGILVEALETTDPDRFLIGVQCHPERLTSTPPAFLRLFRAFVQAAAVRAASRDAGLPEAAARR